MSFAADELSPIQGPARAGARSWREAVQAFAEAVCAHESALDGEEETRAAFEANRPFFPQSLRETLYVGAYKVDVPIEFLTTEVLTEILERRRFMESEIASLVAAFVQWSEATARVKADVGHSAIWEAIGDASEAREAAYLEMLETPAPDFAALAEKIQLVADESGWPDDPRAKQVAVLAQDARRLCARA